MAKRIRKKTAQVTRSPRPMRQRLEEAEQTLHAIRRREVDAIVVGGPKGDRVFTLTGADHDYRVLMDEMSEGVATLAENGVVAYCNLRFASIVGLPAERVVGASINRISARGRLGPAHRAPARGPARGEQGRVPAAARERPAGRSAALGEQGRDGPRSRSA